MLPENLHKSKTNKVFAGVCGGLAEYFRVDATLIRLAWALAVFVGGSGLIIYILAMIIMPDDPAYVSKTSGSATVQNEPSPAAGETGQEPKPVYTEHNGDSKRRQILGLILVCIGAYFLLERWFPFFNMHNWWPVIIILLGVFVLFKGKGGSK